MSARLVGFHPATGSNWSNVVESKSGSAAFLPCPGWLVLEDADTGERYLTPAIQAPDGRLMDATRYPGFSMTIQSDGAQ
jgi:hypothetical protein